jgi:beta-mannosidase
VHLVNERSSVVKGQLELCRYATDGACVSRNYLDVEIPAHDHAQYSWDELLDGFADLTWSYRFGPSAYESAHARLHTKEAGGARTIIDGWYLPQPALTAIPGEIGLEGDIEHEPSGLQLSIRARRFARAVAIDLPGYEPDDQYFNMAPGSERRILLRARASAHAHATGYLRAINSSRHVIITLPS